MLLFKNLEVTLKIMDKKGKLIDFFNNLKIMPLKDDYYSNMRILVGLSSIFKLSSQDLEILVLNFLYI